MTYKYPQVCIWWQALILRIPTKIDHPKVTVLTIKTIIIWLLVNKFKIKCLNVLR